MIERQYTIKKQTQTYRIGDDPSIDWHRCTTQTQMAFNIEPTKTPECGRDVKIDLEANGYKVEWLEEETEAERIQIGPGSYATVGGGKQIVQNVKLNQFIADHPEGDYLVFTADHAMALRDGTLTDTAFGTGRRTVKYAWTVTK